jgi:hypothetical protein
VTVLDQHPAVKTSIVLAREVEPGDKRLIAYFVSAAKVQPTHSELRNFIAARLPEYMIPGTFVDLDALPLTPSGKVNRAALPEPHVGNILRDSTLVEPRTPIEKRMADILAALLDVGQVSVEDNFFLLGAHSSLYRNRSLPMGCGRESTLNLESSKHKRISKFSAQFGHVLAETLGCHQKTWLIFFSVLRNSARSPSKCVNSLKFLLIAWAPKKISRRWF